VGTLFLVATPIGNLEDVTLRALRVLSEADLVLAEDTRRTRILLDRHGISARPLSLHAHNEAARAARVLALLEAGGSAALVADAGTPLVSDPGFKLVRAALDSGHRVVPVPGASAALAALAAAGLPTDRFVFAGFPPPKKAARDRFLSELADAHATLVFYETGPRLAQSLAAMAAVFGRRDAAIARELTKLFEEFRRGALDALAADLREEPPPKGEMVILIGPPPHGDNEVDSAVVDAALRSALERTGVKQAAAEIAERFALSRREVYARALALKHETS
jgi:16S rRNA (cytidine1402-2'-O)-methyltransferase